jgi:beta-fructofuranosidase
MNTDLLKKAREYEAVYGQRITDEERPVYHVTPTVGWLNDPNGFSFYKGRYHLFYQYNPYSTEWDTMHWGHLASDDLIHWDRLPAALAPSQDCDDFGVWSGTAMTAPDGRHLLMYTAVKTMPDKDGEKHIRQTQCLAYGDGTDYVKYENNPVIVPEQLPEGSKEEDFRDPKIWFDEKDGCYYCILGSSTEKDGGTIVLFKSQDIHHWEFVSTLAKSEGFGYMWECPDLFRLNQTDFLLFLPMKLTARGLEFHCGNNAAYLTGNLDMEKKEFIRRGIFSLDYGIDFYAPQTMLAPDGRRIMSAWMQTPETKAHQPKKIKWFGQMIFPRELSEKDGKLIQNPIRELEAFRKDPVFYRDFPVRERTRLPRVEGRCLDMTVKVRPAGAGLFRKFILKFAENDEFFTSVTFDPEEGLLIFDRTYSGFTEYTVSERKLCVRNRGGEITLRILLDRFSAEIFVNDGEQTLSNTIYTAQEAKGISFEAKGGTALIDVEKYTIEI